MRRLLIPALTLVAGCTAAQEAAAPGYQAQIAAACNVAIMVGAADPAIGIYIVAACKTEEAIARLALDPTALAWVNGLIAKVRQEPTPLLPR